MEHQTLLSVQPPLQRCASQPLDQSGARRAVEKQANGPLAVLIAAGEPIIAAAEKPSVVVTTTSMLGDSFETALRQLYTALALHPLRRERSCRGPH
jgi:hypothetical protein